MISLHNQQIVDYRLIHPEYTLQRIATRFSLSRERIRQILKANHVRTKSTLFGVTPEDRICPTCLGLKNRESKTCKKCFIILHRMTISCSICGTLITRKKSYIMKNFIDPRYTGRFFCSPECLSKGFRVKRSK